MDIALSMDSASRFAAYVEGVASVIGHADRVGPRAGFIGAPVGTIAVLYI